MSLEEKAKTTKEIWAIYEKDDDWRGISKWVSLEEAQRLEDSIKLHEKFDRDYDAQISENDQLKVKIAVANEILDLADFEDLTGAHKIHWSNWQTLREILSGIDKQNINGVSIEFQDSNKETVSGKEMEK